MRLLSNISVDEADGSITPFRDPLLEDTCHLKPLCCLLLVTNNSGPNVSTPFTRSLYIAVTAESRQTWLSVISLPALVCKPVV